MMKLSKNHCHLIIGLFSAFGLAAARRSVPMLLSRTPVQYKLRRPMHLHQVAGKKERSEEQGVVGVWINPYHYRYQPKDYLHADHTWTKINCLQHLTDNTVLSGSIKGTTAST